MRPQLLLTILIAVFQLSKLHGQTLYIPGSVGTSTTSNIGIGIKEPSAKLHLYEGNGSGTHYLKMEGIGEYATVGLLFKTPATDISLTAFRGMMGIVGGNLGIGTNSPYSPLHITAENQKLKNYFWHQTITDDLPQAAGVGGGITFMGRKADKPTPLTGIFGAIDGYKENNISGNELGGVRLWYSNGTNLVEGLRLNSNGNIVVGSPSIVNNNYRLNVDGKIRANEIVVNTSGADFVFDPTYKLRTLTELENFIKEHKHLPEIAPAKEMQENGVSAGEMQTKLLQKVEELTLYVIELKKENIVKETRLNDQQQLILKLLSEVDNLKQKANLKH